MVAPNPQTEEDSDKAPNKEANVKSRIGEIEVNPEVTENFGPWMLVRSRVRKPQNSHHPHERKDAQRKGKETAMHGAEVNHDEGWSLIRKSKYAILDLEGEENLVEDYNVDVSGVKEDKKGMVLMVGEKNDPTCKCRIIPPPM